MHSKPEISAQPAGKWEIRRSEPANDGIGLRTLAETEVTVEWSAKSIAMDRLEAKLSSTETTTVL